MRLQRAMASSSKKLQHNILSYETSSDRKIAYNMYYIISIELERESSSLIKKLIRKVYEEDGMPLICYLYANNVYLLFSSLENPDTNHFLGGSHHKLCSYFSSTISREKDMNVTCSIIEMDSRTKVLIYFQTKVYENTKRTVEKLLKGKVNKKEFENLSMFESLELLKTNSINWQSIPSIERFGTFYKYVEGEGGKGKLSTLSELFDVRDMEKYNAYFFG